MNFHRYPNTFIGTVHIKVENLERSVEFYQSVIGLHILDKEERSAVMGAGTHPLLVIEEPKNVIPKQGRTTGLFHFAILLPTRADLGKKLRHLLEIDYPIGASDHLVSEALYLDDPDGNGIEIYADRPSSGWNWANQEVEMATKPLDAQSLLAEAGKEKWMGIPEGTIMGHIHLHVANLKDAKNFYGDGLGFNLVSRYPQALFMSTGGYHHHLGLNTWNGIGAPPPKDNSVGLKQFSLIFAGEKERGDAASRLKEIGAEVTEDYKVKDPSGNLIQLNVI
ncbi:VOC family protein [Neobacillus notoginsengisoli]|uniref:VOC family protein n=1 Tax=Neobacillus notoginsengisoli TaxID=1578198 RepID=A0A417YN95_9BACI|nr:VOC family protein [Neobacillus notoginsengisoli]RHW34880.1 VOC family protein [Neobacillus notoginsengisoli]